MHRSCRRGLLLGVSLAFFASAAAAQQAPQPGSDPFTQNDTLGAADLAAEVVTQGSLTLGQSTQTLTATNSGNTVTGETVHNGDISLATGAFSGFSGIGNFVMNTGNNSNLQGSISVVVVMPTTP